MITTVEFTKFCRKCAAYAPDQLGNVKAIFKVVTENIQCGEVERVAVEEGMALLRQHGMARDENGLAYKVTD